MLRLWNRLSVMGVEFEPRPAYQRRIILLNRLAITLFVIVFLLRTMVIALDLQTFSVQSIIPFLTIFGILLIPYFNSKGHYRITSFTFCLIVPICFLVFSTLAQSANTAININHYYLPRIFIMVSLVLPLILLDTRKKSLLIVAILVNVLCILSYDAVVELIGVPFNVNTTDFEHYNSISYIMVLPIALLIMAFLLLTNLNHTYEDQIIGLNTNLIKKNGDLESFNKEVKEQRDIIEAQNTVLTRFNEELIHQRDTIAMKNDLLLDANSKIKTINQQLTDSIDYAETIQRAVLDKEQLPENYFADSFIYFQPLSRVSGDFYYYKKHTINQKPCIVVAAADCTGHGVPGGFLSMMGLVLLNEVLLNLPNNNAAEILNHLRDRIKTTLKQTSKISDQQDGMDMALCIYYPDTKELDFAGARNPLCIINNSGEFIMIKGDRQPIGIYLKENAFINHHFNFEGGEMIYIFSDGFIEQFAELKGTKKAIGNLKAFLLSLYSQPCHKQKSELDMYLLHWTDSEKHEFEQFDDIVVVGMRI